MDGTGIAEAHLDLGRVHVDVDARRVDLDEQHVGRLLLAVQHVLVGGAQRVGDEAVAHVAAVDVDVLVVAARARRGGQADAAVDGDRADLGGERAAVVHELVAQHVADALRLVGRAPLLDQLALVPHGEAHARPHQRVAAHGLDAVRQLGGVGLQELAPRRRAEEQLAHLDGGALRAGGRRELAGARVQPLRVRGRRRAADQRQLRHRRDRRQRLAAEAHRGHRLEVVERADLAGGVALERERQLGRLDADAVVLDQDGAHAARDQADVDLRGAGVERVVDQLAHHGRRPLDDLARGDLADQFVG